MDVTVGTVIDVIRDYPGTDKHTMAEIAMYRSRGCSSANLERVMIETAKERQAYHDTMHSHYIIGRVMGYRPLFSVRPHVHQTHADAVTEQMRLTDAYGGVFAMYAMLKK
jgi:hypothetical protein